MTITTKQPSNIFFYIFILTSIFFACVYIINTKGQEDTNPPVISNVKNHPPTTNSAVIVWTTDEPANTEIEFGTPTSTDEKTRIIDENLTTDHLVNIAGLLPKTMYEYCVYSRDAANNEARSCGYTFTTEAESPIDEVPPEITDIVVSEINPTWVKIIWNTNEIADARIEYGTTTEYGNMARGDGSFSTGHAILISDLTSETLYHFRVISADGSGNISTSADLEFTTTRTGDGEPTPPPSPSGGGHHHTESTKDSMQISEITASEITLSSVKISFATNNLAAVQVEYGFTDKYGESTVSTPGTTKKHSVKLINLKQNTMYNFRAIAIDGNNKKTFSSNLKFKTLSNISDTTPPSYIHDLSVSDIDNNSIELSWSAPYDKAGILFYDINYSDKTLSDANFYDNGVVHETIVVAEAIEKHGKIHSYRVIGLPPGKLGYFAIKASDSFGNISNISNIVSATLPGGQLIEGEDVVPPAMVKKVQAIGFDRVITMWWKNPRDPDFVRTRVVRNSDHYPEDYNDGEIIYEGGGNVVSDAPLKNNTTYYYAIFAHDSVPNFSIPVRFSMAPSANKQGHTLSNIGTVDHIALSLLITSDLKRGDTNHEVKHLQSILATDPNLYKEGLVTGYFGPLTERAVSLLQGKNNLPTTGKVDIATREIINELPLTGFLAQEIGNEMLTIFAHDIYYGARGDDVRALQAHLVKHGLLNPSEITGIYGPKTKAAVIKLQEVQGTPMDGIVGPITRAKIIDHVYEIMEEEGLLSPR